MRIELLADHPSSVPLVSDRHFDDWGASYPGTTRAQWSDELAGRCERDRIPITLVAIVDAEPVGSASLVDCDMDTRRDLSPWLASVSVVPTLRGRGIGTALVTEALTRARALGVRHLYLWTHSAAALYRELGWRPLCEGPHKGRTVLVMVCDPRACQQPVGRGTHGEASMDDDAQAIRDLVAGWLRATAARAT